MLFFDQKPIKLKPLNDLNIGDCYKVDGNYYRKVSQGDSYSFDKNAIFNHISIFCVVEPVSLLIKELDD